MQFNFEKEEDGKWYIVLPEWTGSKADLEMVCGADYMLDLLSNNTNSVSLDLSEEECEHDFILDFTKEEGGGGWYNLVNFNHDTSEINNEIWLCMVTRFVFNGFLPNRIYVSLK